MSEVSKPDTSEAAVGLAASLDGGPQPIDDPVRDYSNVVKERVAATLRFVEGQCYQHLPKSSQEEFLSQLKEAL